jgi:serine/threonine-protein kinase
MDEQQIPGQPPEAQPTEVMPQAESTPAAFGGKFTPVQRLDSGGAGETWRATDSGGHTVVVKSYAGLDASQLANAQAIAQAASRVQSAYVVRVLDWGVTGDQFYLVREYVAGTDLASIIAANGPVRAEESAKYGAEISGAAAALHAVGVVHGNIKPANVLVTTSDEIKLVGLGWVPGPTHVNPNAPSTATMYMSPEQIQGGSATYASDVYGIGTTVYSAVTGRAPYAGNDAAEVARNVLGVIPAPPAQIVAVPAPLEAIINQAMNKDPQARQTSAQLLQQQFMTIAGETRIISPVAAAAPVPEKKRSLMWLWLLLGALALLLIGGGAYWYVTQQNTVAVPNLKGQSLVQATATLNALGLAPGTIGYTNTVDSAVPAGAVETQDPAANARVAKGSKVSLTLNGPQLVDLVDVTGQTEAQAISTLVAAGFQTSVKQEFNKKVVQGNVVSQTPSGGTKQPKGSTITLVVSKGVQQGTIPNVVGETQADATTALQKAGYKVAVKTSTSNTVSSGDVISQSPSGGATAATGVTVTIVVSTGSNLVSVPNVVGQNSTNASNSLTEAGFQVIVSGSSSPTATVETQSPAASTKVAKGTSVTIVVGP